MTFMCDPKKNTQCRSPLCFEHGGPCGATERPEYAVRDLFGRPVRLIENEQSKMKGENDELLGRV